MAKDPDWARAPSPDERKRVDEDQKKKRASSGSSKKTSKKTSKPTMATDKNITGLQRLSAFFQGNWN